MSKKFNILSIDGGGIKGVFPAKFLANMEERLKELGYEHTSLKQYFDLICGTSTGGIIAIALGLGIPAQTILDIYLNHAKDIFGNRRPWYGQLWYAKHDRTNLEKLIRNTFKEHFGGEDPRLNDCKPAALCIPIFDLFEGKPSVLKTRHHERFTRDYHIPAYQAALATAAAPTYFDPFSGYYKKIGSDTEESFTNKVDGGVFANNPALLGIIEAQKAFGKSLHEIQVLSIGTGTHRFSDLESRSKWGILYWINLKRKRMIDLFMQSQSQQVNNLISLLKNGIDRSEPDNFIYNRINVEFDSDFEIEIDETDRNKLNKLVEKASIQFQNHGTTIIDTYCRHKKQ